jgi:sodium-independent sulfate anion transporter 11
MDQHEPSINFQGQPEFDMVKLENELDHHNFMWPSLKPHQNISFYFFSITLIFFFNSLPTTKKNPQSPEKHDYSEKFPDIRSIARRKAARFFSIEGLHRRLPVTKWLPKYKTSYVVPDFVAGLTVALTVIPQGIADAALANLDPQYGLYAGFMGCFVYFFFGSTKDLTIGPTAILSILTYTVVGKLNADLAVFSTFVSGCIITLLGVLNLGFLMQFLSMPTVCAFMNAATVTIASGQLRRLLGITSGKTNEFIDSWVNLVKYIGETKLSDTLLGVISLLLLVAVKQWSMRNKKSLFIRYLSISRNAIAVFGGILIAYLMHINGRDSFVLTGEIESGFPSVTPPPFETTHNGTYYGFTDMIGTLGLSAISIPLISVIEAIAIAKSFNRGKTLDVTQEMIALGLCNLTSSFVRSIPITGSFTRSAVNHASGVKVKK